MEIIKVASGSDVISFLIIGETVGLLDDEDGLRNRHFELTGERIPKIEPFSIPDFLKCREKHPILSQYDTQILLGRKIV